MIITVFIWLLASLAAYVYVTGIEHAYSIKHHPLLLASGDHKPLTFGAFFMCLAFPPTAIVATHRVFGGEGWVWPKKGVTYK